MHNREHIFEEIGPEWEEDRPSSPTSDGGDRHSAVGSRTGAESPTDAPRSARPKSEASAVDSDSDDIFPSNPVQFDDSEPPPSYN